MTLETQLWLWLEDCEARKPVVEVARPRSSGPPDRAVRVLQDEVREGREAREAGDGIKGLSSKTQ